MIIFNKSIIKYFGYFAKNFEKNVSLKQKEQLTCKKWIRSKCMYYFIQV